MIKDLQARQLALQLDFVQALLQVHPLDSGWVLLLVFQLDFVFHHPHSIVHIQVILDEFCRYLPPQEEVLG